MNINLKKEMIKCFGIQFLPRKRQMNSERALKAAEQIEFVGFKVNDNGVVEYFAKLRDDNNAYYAKLKEQRAEAKEAKKIILTAFWKAKRGK